ncbi:MAG TPA: FMN-binding protein [Polyangia bacterium]|nr:FMN-binding protein [Polyangia bacterium]
MIFKTVIKWAWIGLALLVLPVGVRSARAETVYYTPRSVLTDFFPRSETVRFQRFLISMPMRERLSQRLGYQPKRDSYVFYVATTGGHVDGYALIDEELGQTEPITFAVKLSPDGTVERTEVMIYREPRGDEVRCRRFLDQMRGKTVRQPVRDGVDIDAVSGATISSHSLATGVRRALLLFDELVARSRETARADAR